MIRPVLKPVKGEKKGGKKKIKRTPEAIIIDKIDRIDSDICLIENGFVCIICGGMAGFNHHFFHKGNYGVLRFEPDNHCPVDYGCHEFTIHTKGDVETLRDNLIAKIGQERFDLLKEKGRFLADRSMPYLREELARKKHRLLSVVQLAPEYILCMMNNSMVKRLNAIKKELSA
jgi:hypothetical protein